MKAWDCCLRFLAEELRVQCATSRKNVLACSIFLFCSLQGKNNLSNQWFHMQQTGLLSAQNLVFIFIIHVCPGWGRRAITGQGEKEKCDHSSCPPANRKRQSSLCPPSCCDQSPVAMSSQRRAVLHSGLQASCTRLSLELSTFDSKAFWRKCEWCCG